MGRIRDDFRVHINLIQDYIGGGGSFSVGGRDFDGGVGNRWWEAESGNYWKLLEVNSNKLAKSKFDTGDRLRIETEKGATYELFSNMSIPIYGSGICHHHGKSGRRKNCILIWDRHLGENKRDGLLFEGKVHTIS